MRKFLFTLSILSLYGLAYNLIHRFLIIYLRDVVKLDVVFIGTIFTLGAFIGMGISILSGFLADVIGRKYALMLFMSVLPITLLTLLLSPFSISLIVFSIILLYVSTYGTRAPARVLVSEIASLEKVGRRVGTYFSAVAVVSALGPIVGGYVIKTYNYEVLFSLSLLFAMVALSGALFLEETYARYPHRTNSRRGIGVFVRSLWKNIVKCFSNPYLRLYYLLFSLYLLAYEITIPYIPLYLKSIFQLNEFEIGSIFTLISFIVIPSYLLGGLLSDRLGSARAMVLVLTINALITPLLPFMNKLLFILLLAISNFIFSSHEAPETSFVVKVTTPEIRATATATASFIQSIITSPGPLIGGLIWSSLSPKANFWITSFIALASILMFGLPLLKSGNQ